MKGIHSIVPTPFQDKIGRSCLHIAAEANQTEAVNIIVNMYGITVNCLSTKGQNPLHYAAREGHEVLIRQLIALGVEVNARDQVSSK